MGYVLRSGERAHKRVTLLFILSLTRPESSSLVREQGLSTAGSLLSAKPSLFFQKLSVWPPLMPFCVVRRNARWFQQSNDCIQSDCSWRCISSSDNVWHDALCWLVECTVIWVPFSSHSETAIWLQLMLHFILQHRVVYVIINKR